MWQFTKNYSLLLLTCSLFCYGCGNSYHEIFSQLVIPEKAKVIDDTIILEKRNKLPVSRLTKKATAGLNCSYILPDSLVGKELKIVFKGLARSNFVYSHASIIVTVFNDRNEQIIWKPFSLRYHFLGENKWSPFSDSLFLPGSFDNHPYQSIRVFSFHGNSDHEVFDVAYLNVQLKAKR